MEADTTPIALTTIAKNNRIEPKLFEQQYKNYLSDYNIWNQKDHATEYMLFPQNLGEYLSIDETSISNGELYTILTNKEAHGKMGALVAICKGTKSEEVITVLKKIPISERNKVKEVTLDMSNSMEKIVKDAFPNAEIVIDRFHVQQLVTQAVQDIRIDLRRQVLKRIHNEIKNAKENKIDYKATTYGNGDSERQLLARSRYLLFKPDVKWTESQKIRAEILFKEFPIIKKAYKLSMTFRSFYQNSLDKNIAEKQLIKWYKDVAELKIESEEETIENDIFEYFNSASETIKDNQNGILRYFIRKSTNASAESFNAKLKGFRGLVRGVRDTNFFMFRISKLYG